MAVGRRIASGPLCANGRGCDGGVRAASGGFVAGCVAVGVAVGGSVRGGLRGVCGVQVCADRVRDCRGVRVVQRAAAPAVSGGQRGDGQSLLDESGDVLYCLGDQGTVPPPLLVLLRLPRPLPVPVLLPVARLSQFQLPTGRGFRGGALPFAEGSVGHGCVERAGPHASHRFVGWYLGLFGLTGSYVVVVTAPHGFGRVVGCEKAWRQRRRCGVAEVKPLCDAGDNFLSLLQQ